MVLSGEKVNLPGSVVKFKNYLKPSSHEKYHLVICSDF